MGRRAAVGWIGGGTWSFQDIKLTVTNRNATVAVQSLDGQPISTSHSLMISLGARDASLRTYWLLLK